MSTSAARVRLKPEMIHQSIQLPWFSIRVFFLHFPSIWYRFDIISTRPLAENGGMAIYTAWGRAKPK
jgi:hypothetical protein